MITGGRQSAGVAVMPAIRKCLRNSRPADACLTRATRAHFDQLAPSIFRFVRNLFKEGIPPRVMYGLGKHSARQPFNVQVFYDNSPVAIHQPTTNFVVKAGPLVLDLLVRLSNKHTGFRPALARFLSTCHLSLASPQDCSRTVKVSGVVDLCPIGQRSQRNQPHVDADLLQRFRQRLRVSLYRKAGIPPINTAFDGDPLNLSFNRTVQLNFDLARSLNTKLAVAEQAASVAIRKSNTVETPRRFESRKSRLIAALAACEERLEGFVETAQDVLAARKVRECEATIGTHCLQLVRLIVVVDRLAAELPSANSLFKPSVVQRARFAKLAVQKLNLSFSGIQAVFERGAQYSRIASPDALAYHLKVLATKGRNLFLCQLKQAVSEV